MSLYQAEYELTVPFEDLDPMNIVWYGNYMRYMEHARCHLLSELKYTYNNMKIDGYAYPVAKMKVKYIKPAIFGDLLSVRVEILSIEPALDIKYTIYKKETGEKIFEGSTMHIAINFETGESVYTPPKGLAAAISGVCNEKI